MRKRIISMLFVLSAFIVPASVQAQWVVSDPGNLVQGIVNSVNEIVETSETAQNALSTWKETSKIFEQGREYYDKLRKVNDLISGSEKVKESVLMLGEEEQPQHYRAEEYHQSHRHVHERQGTH